LGNSYSICQPRFYHETSALSILTTIAGVIVMAVLFFATLLLRLPSRLNIDNVNTAFNKIASAVMTEYTGTVHFFVLKRGSKEPKGPFSDEDLVIMMNNGELSITDFVFYEGLGEWKPIGEVFELHEQISHFVDDGQDTENVALAFREVSNVVEDTESVYYIAVQARVGLLSKTKQCVIITEKHVFIMHERRVGFELEAYLWKDVTNTLMRDDGKGLGSYSILLGAEKRLDVINLPLKQVQRLFQLSQEMKMDNLG